MSYKEGDWIKYKDTRREGVAQIVLIETNFVVIRLPDEPDVTTAMFFNEIRLATPLEIARQVVKHGRV